MPLEFRLDWSSCDNVGERASIVSREREFSIRADMHSGRVLTYSPVGRRSVGTIRVDRRVHGSNRDCAWCSTADEGRELPSARYSRDRELPLPASAQASAPPSSQLFEPYQSSQTGSYSGSLYRADCPVQGGSQEWRRFRGKK